MCRMASALELAPGIPKDYYRRIFEDEERHWWYRGMLSITAALLGERLTRPGQRLLDAGCGTGGFLELGARAWLLRVRRRRRHRVGSN